MIAFDGLEVADAGRAPLAAVANRLRARPGNEAYIVGHSATFGARERNREISLERARKIETILVKRGVEPEQIAQVVGVGPDELLTRDDGESPMAFQRRLARVEVVVE